MSSDRAFFSSFREKVIGVGVEDEDDGLNSHRVAFYLEQFKMIPTQHKDFICNITKGYPTPPIYVLLALGSIGTNIARCSVVRRIGGHRNHVERTGAFYNLIAPSRLGKGIAISLVSDIRSQIEDIRSKNYDK